MVVKTPMDTGEMTSRRPAMAAWSAAHTLPPDWRKDGFAHHDGVIHHNAQHQDESEQR